MTPHLQTAFEKGKTIIVDEIENSLHPLLVEEILKMFSDPIINKSNAQLIFSTHDVNLLSLDNFRRDQIYFLEKNPKTASSEIYSLDEFPVRKGENIRKGYLQGRYGAIPFIGGGASDKSI
jgi:AAA15 family ATPase/GTPase